MGGLARPPLGRDGFWASVSVDFTYGYSRFPALRDGNDAALMGAALTPKTHAILPLHSEPAAYAEAIWLPYHPKVSPSALRGEEYPLTTFPP